MTSCDSAEKALGSLAEAKFDLVITDLEMPRMDGFELSLRIQQAGYQLPVICLTAHALQEKKEQAKQANIRFFLTKPLDFENLLAKLKTLL